MMRRTGVGVVEDFSAIEELLTEWGYLSGWQLTEKGRRLRFIYNELDLLLVESIEEGMFLGLSPEELAALISVFVFEPRTDRPSAPIFPTPTIAERFGLIGALSDRLARRERSGRLTVTRAPDPGFVDLAHAWASGVELEDLPDHVLAPGDFVRVARQLVDLLRQVREAAPALTADARIALADIDRGVVAAGGAV
jgi:ATP-dependent RNA helicase HelY